MDIKAVNDAAERLERARRAVESMRTASTYVDGRAAWSDFILAANTIYSKLEQGAKTSGASEAWFGRKVRERKTDPLLRYLHHARNVDEHGVAWVTQENKGDFEITTDDGRTFTGEIEENSDADQTIAEFPVSAKGQMRLRFRGPHLSLVPVLDRGVKYDPPELHLGSALISNTPLKVGEIALRYLDALVSEAKALV